MSLIVDASVAVKWVAAEPKSDEARRVLLRPDERAAPILLVPEVVSALWKKLKLGLVAQDQMLAAPEALSRAIDRWADVLELAPAATALAVSLKHPICDCLYLALAIRDGGTLVTADEHLSKLPARVGTMVQLI